MNKELRRRPRQSGSHSSAGVPVAGPVSGMPLDRRRFLIGMTTIATDRRRHARAPLRLALRARPELPGGPGQS